ncbi:hypothetical protein ACLHZ0_19925 [Aeromonas salmonicida]|uniref:hypothetical protein n=1 Tax=Aeromonas salmonicida TaxID=645 RepID=UPI003CFC1C9B
MNFRSRHLLLLVAGLLSGCDASEELGIVLDPNAIEIPAGYKVQIDGKPVPISGASRCVNGAHLTAILPPLRNCVVITPETKVVEVWVGYPERPLKEAWTVKKVGEQTMLVRGDSSYVIR